MPTFYHQPDECPSCGHKLEEKAPLMKRVIYLAGPMKGLPERNYPMFNSVAAKLRAAGHRVYNPAEYPENGKDGFNVRKAFASYAVFICLEADTIVVLPGYMNSVGASTEASLGEICGLPILKWGQADDMFMLFDEGV